MLTYIGALVATTEERFVGQRRTAMQARQGRTTTHRTLTSLDEITISVQQGHQNSPPLTVATR